MCTEFLLAFFYFLLLILVNFFLFQWIQKEGKKFFFYLRLRQNNFFFDKRSFFLYSFLFSYFQLKPKFESNLFILQPFSLKTDILILGSVYRNLQKKTLGNFYYWKLLKIQYYSSILTENEMKKNG